VIASFTQIADDLERLGLDATDVRTAAAVAAGGRATLDEVQEPRLLAGDLWTVNCMLDPEAPEPLISGVLDFDRAEFGDPAADWTIRMAQAKPDEREASGRRTAPGTAHHPPSGAPPSTKPATSQQSA